MNPLLPLMVAALAAAACSNLERSRNLANAAVPAETIAQQVCSICHGLDGNAMSPNFPSLAGQSKRYLVAQLQAFRRHSRSDKAATQYMWGLTRSLSDEQIDGLAAYFSAQAPRSPGAGEAQRMARGEQIFRKGIAAQKTPACRTCHGDNAEGSYIAPRLASQHASYVAKQLMVFQTTSDRPDGFRMKEICRGLTAENMTDVAHYVQSLASPRLVSDAPPVEGAGAAPGPNL